MRYTAKLDHGVLRDQIDALAGSPHARCRDPKIDQYDWVLVARVLAGEGTGGVRLSHAERVAYARVALRRGHTSEAIADALNLNSVNRHLLIEEARTGKCYIERAVCALPGCETPFYKIDQRRTYCTPAHQQRAREAAKNASLAAQADAAEAA